MTNLSVNINKVATIRNARGGNVPNVLKVALDCEAFGAQGITVHPRPDERHIRYSDVYALKPEIKTEFNIEGYPCEKFIDLVLKVKPTQVTLVPDAPDAITSNAGWDVRTHFDQLSELVETLPHTVSVPPYSSEQILRILNGPPRQEPTVSSYTRNLMRPSTLRIVKKQSLPLSLPPNLPRTWD